MELKERTEQHQCAVIRNMLQDETIRRIMIQELERFWYEVASQN